MAKPPKNIVTNKQNVNKAIEQFGQEKVNAALAKQSAQGTNIVNTDTNTMVAGAGRYAGPDATGLNVVKTPVADAPKPVIEPAPTAVTTPVSTAEAETQAINILPESVTGVKVTPFMQAKIDAKKNPTPVVPTETIAPAETTPTPEVVPTEVKAETTTTPTEVKTEVTDIEKNAQATGVAYTMENGQATYNPKTTEEAAKILAMGGKLAGETKMSAVAQASLNKVRGLGQMTDQQLANNIAGGQVSNKELELLNTINPQLVAQAKELSKKKIITNTTNEIQADNSAIIKGEEPTGMSKPLQDLVNKLATIDADTKSPAEMKTAYQDAHPEMIQSRDQINALTTQKRDLQLAKMNLWKEWKAKNSGLPISMVMSGYSAASRDLDNSIYLINDDLNTEISNYNMYLDDMNAEIDFEIAQQGKEEDRLWQMYGVTRAEEVRSEDIDREDQRIQAAIELEEQRYERDIARDDMKSAQDRKDRLEDLKIQQTFNIETGLMNLGVDPTGMTPEEMRANFAKATGNQIAYDNALAAAKLAPGTTGTNNGLSGNIPAGDLAAYSMNKRGRQNLQCGELANDAWEKMTGTPLGAGDTYDSKLAAIKKVGQSSGPVAGGIFAFPVETFAGNTGHMGVVKSVNPDGSITVLEANRKENSKNGGVPTEGTYTAGQVKNMVFSVSGGNPNSGAYTDSDIELLSELANMDASARNTALKAQGIPLSSVTEYMALAKSGKIPPSEAQKQSSTQIMSQIQDLADMDWNDATGFHVLDNPIAGTDWATAKGKIESLIAAITLPNLGMLKGPMSDKDLAFIQNASTRLNLAQTDKEFEKQLIELYNIGARKNGMSEITKLKEIPKGRILPGQTGDSYTPQEEALIQELAQNGATDEEIDQALNQYRS